MQSEYSLTLFKEKRIRVELSLRQLEIVEAAGRLLTTSGLCGLTIKNLANEMHFAESALYRYFSSKEEIIVTLLQYLADNIDERLQNIPHTDRADENFAVLFRDQFHFFNERPYFVVAVFSDGLMEKNRHINEMIQKLIQIKVKYLNSIIYEGQQNGIFTSEVETDELVSIIMGAFQLLMLKWRISHFQFDITEAGEKMIQSLLTLLKKP